MQTRGGHVVRALTVAGSDSGGGAGIQADLKTFAAFGVYGSSVLTALTAQNTLGVQAVQYVDVELVRQQLDSVLSDIGADAVKTGMLGSAEIVRAVANRFAHWRVPRVVVDPVMVAKGGERLLDESAAAALRQDLFPRATVITPNLPETEVLCGFPVDSWAACHRAAECLHRLGPAWVVIKGGHAQRTWLQAAPWPQLQASEHAVDIVFDGEQFTYLAAPRVPGRKTHGTGCTFSAAVAAALACGSAPLTALAQAKGFIYQAVAAAAVWDVGSGHGPTDHSVQPPSAVELAPGGAYLWVEGVWQAL